MDSIKMILRVLLIFILIILILGILAPKQYRIKHSIEIQAPAALVFNQVRFWENWQAWSPWTELEPAMEVSIQGQDGLSGSEYHWTGKRTGSGVMIHVESQMPERFGYHVLHIKPMPGESDGSFLLEETGGITWASWIYQGRTPIPWNIMNLFVSMDRIAGRDFERGLVLLRDLSERKAVQIAGYPVREVVFSARNFAAIRRSCPEADAASFISESLTQIMNSLASRSIPPAGPPCGLFFAEDSLADVAAAVPVIRWKDSDGIREIRLPSSRAFMVEYSGPREESVSAHLALERYFTRNRLRKKTPVIEEYPTGQPDVETGDSLLRVIYLIN